MINIVEKRSLFQKIFGAMRDRMSLSRLQFMSGYTPTFTPWAGNPYEADAVRAAVDAIARNAAKLKAKHIRRVGAEITPIGGQIERLLQVRPNPNMNAYDFLYKMVTTRMIDNNAFAYPLWNGMTLEAIWPINCNMAEFFEDESGTIYVKFWFGIGKSATLPYSEVIHLRRHFYKGDMSGESNAAINTTLEAIHTTNEGIGQAVKTSANLRGIIKYQGMLKEEDIKKNRDRFVNEYMTMQNSGGIAALDSKAEYKELTSDPKIINAPQMKELRDTVYRYFGVNENIVMSKYTEQEFDGFYESVLEPLAVQMSLEFSSKLFTIGEQKRGNEIVFESSRLQYVSAKTKKEIIKELMPMGIFEIDEAREILNLGPLPNGEGKKRIYSLNYVDADKANKYQLGEEDDPNGGEGQEGDQASGT